MTITTDEPLHEGTEAVIRATSLSGVANRYVSLTLGPDNAPQLPTDGVAIDIDQTTTPVDLDQLFDTFTRGPARASQTRSRALRHLRRQGRSRRTRPTSTSGRRCSATDRLLREIDRDERVFTRFIVNTGRVVDCDRRAPRRPHEPGLEHETVARVRSPRRTIAFDESLQLLPPTLRQANTTFVNLRAALDDLDPLVNTVEDRHQGPRAVPPQAPSGRPARGPRVHGPPPHREPRPATANDARRAGHAPSAAAAPARERLAADARSGAMNASQPMIDSPARTRRTFWASFAKLGQVTGYYDGNGHYARVQAAAFNLFELGLGSAETSMPIPPAEKFNDFETAVTTRCPGGATQPISGSNPFLDQGRLSGKCDPSDVPPGP